MDGTLCENLILLAEAILPLGTWLAGTPSQRTNVLAPWREPFTPQLSVRELGLVDFIERRIDDSSEDDALALRWAQVEADPLAIFNSLPEKGPTWRAARGLTKEPTFGIVESDNVEVILDNVAAGQGNPPAHRASSRREFYGHAFAAFAKVVAAQSPTNWEDFRDKLLKNDASLGWPADCPVTAGRFVRQFAKDLLYGLLGMRDQPAKAQTTAVLAELGEHRRRGNSHSTENVQAAVAALQLRLENP